MPLLKNISLYQFKNHRQNAYSFAHKVTAICGENGSGKTNLLDAIYYLCITKSYFGITDQQLVHFEGGGMRLEGNFVTPNNETLDTVAIIRENGKKEFAVNGENYTRFSNHLGKLPVVMIAPDDTVLITGASEQRRKWLDSLICQTDSEYLQQLIVYNKLLQQRNSLLRQMAEGIAGGNELLDILDAQIAPPLIQIYQTRQAAFQLLKPAIIAHYTSIAEGAETPAISYRQCADSIGLTPENVQQTLLSCRNKDIASQRSSWGIHRDDIVFNLHEAPFKQYASQGQRKSLLFAMKLTEYEWLQQHKKFPPLLLLDDVFEKLDSGRMHNLLKEVCVEKQGQVFITDTHPERLQKQLEEVGADFNIIAL